MLERTLRVLKRTVPLRRRPVLHLGPKQLAIAIDHQVTPVVDTEGREDWIAALHQRRKDGCLGSLTDVDPGGCESGPEEAKGNTCS